LTRGVELQVISLNHRDAPATATLENG
jgi:hypothetical protein